MINNYLKKISKYLSDWKLKLSESITFLGHYKDLLPKMRKDAKNVKFKLNDFIIEQKSKVKYLGIVFSSNFQFNEHVTHILQKVNIAQCQLKNIFSCKLLKKDVKLLAYKQLIRPLILYATPIWANINVISSAQLEKIRVKER